MTTSEVYHDVYPIWTYSYLAVLILVFLFTDLAKYKPVIVLEGFAYILTWVLLTWGTGLPAMQMMQVFIVLCALCSHPVVVLKYLKLVRTPPCQFTRY